MPRTGELIQYTITYLEMGHPPSFARPVPPAGNHALIRADNPPEWYFIALYRAVGDLYLWTDWLEKPTSEVTAFVKDPKVALYTFLQDGWPAGFFMLDTRQVGTCDLAYFGLVPEAVGRGLGGYLLRTALHMGWDQPGVGRMTVNTCTLDHPRALALYQRCGFSPIGQEVKEKILTQDWDWPSDVS